MFETYDDSEIPIPAGLALNGERLWRYAQINTQIPWFYVEYLVDYGDLKSKSVLLIANNEQLEILANRTDIEITQAHVVTPGYVNKTEDWQMNKLKQVFRATRRIGRNKIPVTIYVLSDGREMVYSTDTNEKAQLEDCKTVFSH